VALGPIGASGARLLVTLIYEMSRRDAHCGIAVGCAWVRGTRGYGSGAIRLWPREDFVGGVIQEPIRLVKTKTNLNVPPYQP